MNRSDIQKLQEVTENIEQISSARSVRDKSSAETIADQAVTLLERANAHIRESFDAMQRKLDDLRRVQDEHMASAEASIRAAMAWNDYMKDSMNQINSGIETARGDLAKLTKS